MGELIYRRSTLKPESSKGVRKKAVVSLTEKTRMTLESEVLIYEWAICYPDLPVRDYLTRIKRFDNDHVVTILRLMPMDQWLKKREEVLDLTTASMVKRHIDYVAEMNDVHIKAAKLAIAKAVEMMSRLKVEEYTDDEGNKRFRGFRPQDLHHIIAAIGQAQKIQRMALGLPCDEGSVTVWNKVSTTVAQTTGDSTAGGDKTDKTVMETVTMEQQVQSLTSRFSYDDVRSLISVMKERKQIAEPKDVTPEGL